MGKEVTREPAGDFCEPGAIRESNATADEAAPASGSVRDDDDMGAAGLEEARSKTEAAVGDEADAAEKPIDDWPELRGPVEAMSLRMSWSLQRYVGWDIVKVFLFVLSLIEIGYALLVAVVAARKFDLDLFLVVPILWRTALSMLNDSMPIALLFAVGLVYGRFVADREVSAFKSFGLSYRQLLMPATSAGLVAALIGFLVVGFLAPEMNYSKGNVSTLISAQLRYLGEGWNRHFPFGNYSVWITHYEGRELEGVTLRPQSESATSILPAKATTRAAETFFIWAERAHVLFPEEIAAEADQAPELELPSSLPGEVRDQLVESAAKKGTHPPGTIVFRMYNVTVFLSDEFFNNGEPSNYMHRANISQIDFPYRPADLLPTNRRPKQLSFFALYDAMQKAKQKSGAGSESHMVFEREYYWRWARIASFFLYPALAGLIALFLNAENRYLAFFVSCITVPSAFYGLGSVGQMTGASIPVWLAMLSGSALLFVAFVGGLFMLERKWLR